MAPQATAAGEPATTESDDDSSGDEEEHEMQVDHPERVRILECQTHKGTGTGRKLTRSHGIFTLTHPCGITSLCKEFYVSEGANQVMLALVEYVELLEEFNYDFPLSMCYDDACRFALFLMRKQHRTARAALLSCVDWAVDKFHFPNHVYVSVPVSA